MKQIRKLVALGMVLIGVVASAATTVTGVTPEFRLSIKHDGVRVSSGEEVLTYGSTWAGSTDATVTIRQDGVPLVDELHGEGLQNWKATRNGTYVLTHETIEDGAVTNTLTATFIVEGLDIPIANLSLVWDTSNFVYDGAPHALGVVAKDGDQTLAAGTAYTLTYENNVNAGTALAILTGLDPYVGAVTNEFAIAKRAVTLTSASASKGYDGTPLVKHEASVGGDGFVGDEGVVFAFTGSQTAAGASANAYTYTFADGTLGANYAITQNYGTLTVTKAGMGGGVSGGDEPGSVEVPENGLSKFDARAVYDAAGHTIDTNALEVAFAAVAGEVEVAYTAGAFDTEGEVVALSEEADWTPLAPAYTNAGEYVVWYRVANPNYEPFVHAAKVTISPHSITNAFIGLSGDLVENGQPQTLRVDRVVVNSDGKVSAMWGHNHIEATFTVTGNVQTAAGRYEMSVTGTGNFCGEVRLPWTLHARIEEGVQPLYMAIDLTTGAREYFDGVPAGGWSDVYKTDKLLLRRVEPGTFMMGSPETEFGRAGSPEADWDLAWETQHQVTLSHAYYLGVFEVTVRQWEHLVGDVYPVQRTGYPYAGKAVEIADKTALLGILPQYIHGRSRENWADGDSVADESFMGVLRARTGLAGFDLPTEAQWEYACRAGTTSALYNGKELTAADMDANLDDIACYAYNNGVYKTHVEVVGSYLPNDWGFYDMLGNVDETTRDRSVYDLGSALVCDPWWVSPGSFATRSGSGDHKARVCRAARRTVYDSESHGLRVVLNDADLLPRIAFPTGELVATGLDKVYDGVSSAVAVTAALPGLQVEYGFTRDAIDLVEPPTFKDVCATSVWYRVTTRDYEEHVGSVDVRITPRSLTIISGSAEWTYDGESHACTTVEIGGDGFVEGEGATCAGFPQLLHVAEALEAIDNVFEYALNDGTLAQNYVIERRYGTVKMAKRPVKVVAPTLTKVYDGTPLTFTADEIKAQGMAKEETFAFSDFSAITEVGQVAATFSLGDGTALQSDYSITTQDGSLQVTPLDIARADIALGAVLTYTGGEQTQEVTSVTVGALAVTYGIGGNIGVDAGDYALTVTGTGNFTGTAKKVWTIARKSIADATVTVNLDADVFDYTGEALTPVVGARDSARGVALGDGADFIVAYADNVLPGTATVTIEGNGNYSGSRTLNFSIGRKSIDSAGFVVTLASSSCTYNGKLQQPAVSIANGAKVLTEGVDFAVDYADNKNVGTAMVTVRGIGVYCGEVAKRFTIVPLAVTVKSMDKSKVYDGAALTFCAGDITVSGLAEGDSFVYGDFAGIVGVGQVSATFTIAAGGNTKLSNYTITPVYGTLTVTKAKIGGDDGEEPGDGEVPEGGLSKFDAEHVFNGEDQTINVEALEAALAATLCGDYVVEYAFGGDNGEEPAEEDWWEEAPGIRDVGEAVVWYRVLSENYDAFAYAARVRVTPKQVTGDMLAYSDDAFFFDGNDTKVPDVILADTNAWGTVISTVDDFIREYGDRVVETGEYPVTITGRNNYTGTVTKSFKVVKRPVAMPVIGSMSYNGKNRKPTIPEDPRWEVVANPGEVNAGTYTNVVLKLTNTDDYMWKGLGEDAIYCTGVFTITKAGNGWSRMPSINSWTNGVGKVELGMGHPRYGETSYVTYRVRGTDLETATRTVPTAAGQYTARFVVEDSTNYTGVSKDVDFEIYPGVDVPPPEDDGELLALISIDSNNQPVITWRWKVQPSDPDVQRTYIILGKEKLDDPEWEPVTDGNRGRMRFFKVRVRR